MGLEFPRSARLVESRAYHAVRTRGRSLPSRLMLLGVLPQPDPADVTRFGIVTSKRVGNAVTRNRVRRRLREILRHHRARVQSGLWVVIVVRAAASRANFCTLEDELLRLLKRASILQPAP